MSAGTFQDVRVDALTDSDCEAPASEKMCLGSSDPNAKEDVSKETLPKPVPERKAKAKSKAKAAQTKAKACFKRPAMADSSTAKKPKTTWRGETGMCISGNNPVPDFVSDDDDEDLGEDDEDGIDFEGMKDLSVEDPNAGDEDKASTDADGQGVDQDMDRKDADEQAGDQETDKDAGQQAEDQDTAGKGENPDGEDAPGAAEAPKPSKKSDNDKKARRQSKDKDKFWLQERKLTSEDGSVLYRVQYKTQSKTNDVALVHRCTLVPERTAWRQLVQIVVKELPDWACMVVASQLMFECKSGITDAANMRARREEILTAIQASTWLHMLKRGCDQGFKFADGDHDIISMIHARNSELAVKQELP